MIDSSKHDPKHDSKHEHKLEIPGRALVGLFETSGQAKRALAALHKAHFTKTWFGTTSSAVTNSGEEALTAESKGGFFSSDAKRLVDALTEQDVDIEVARRIEMEAVPGSAIVTVRPPDDDKHDPNEALEILSRFGAVVDSRVGAAAFTHAGSQPYSSSLDDGFDDTLVWEEETFYGRR